MRSIICAEPFALQLAERPEPIRSGNDVLIRIRRVGLCGTDYHIYSGDQPFLSYPRVMGHELAGEVIEVNEGSALVYGQMVT